MAVKGKDIQIGDDVVWAWGTTQAAGQVRTILAEPSRIPLNGQMMLINASRDLPVYLIRQADGTELLKLRPQIEKAKKHPFSSLIAW